MNDTKIPNSKHIYLLLALLIIMSFGTCNQKQKNKFETSSETMNITKREEDMQKLKEGLNQEIKQAINESDKKIKKLKSHLNSSREDAQSRIDEAIRNIKKEREKLESHSEKISDVTDATFEKIKDDVHNVVNEANTVIDSLVNSVEEFVKQD